MATPQRTVADSLRKLMRLAVQPVAVITANIARDSKQRHMHGATLSTFTSVSLNPPLIAFSLQLPSRMASYLSDVPKAPFKAYLLSIKQQELAETFARSDHKEPQFAESSFSSLPQHALGILDCHVVQTISLQQFGESADDQTNCLFLATASEVKLVEPQAEPLVWYNQAFGRVVR